MLEKMKCMPCDLKEYIVDVEYVDFGRRWVTVMAFNKKDAIEEAKKILKVRFYVKKI